MVDTLGLIGSTLLAVCALPEVTSSVRKGYCGTSWSFLAVWFLGEVATLLYIIFTSRDIFLLANYSVNVILILVLFYYKSKPVKPQPVKTLDFTNLRDFNA